LPGFYIHRCTAAIALFPASAEEAFLNGIALPGDGGLTAY
jgi:hypothetical protein